VAAANVPCNIVLHVRPPEAKRNDGFHGENHFVTDVIVGGSDDFDVTIGKGNDLVSAVGIFAP
jgi:hypothetical protein